MVHLHKEDDAMVLIQLVQEFGLKAVANHCLDVHREENLCSIKSSLHTSYLWSYGCLAL